MKNPRRRELAKPGLWSGLRDEVGRMRRAPTSAEETLWQRLRGGQVGGLKFRRQHAIHRFIVDFYCVHAALVVEVDGPIHDGQAEADMERQKLLESHGLRVLRFRNEQVLTDIEKVVREIETAVADRHR